MQRSRPEENGKGRFYMNRRRRRGRIYVIDISCLRNSSVRKTNQTTSYITTGF